MIELYNIFAGKYNNNNNWMDNRKMYWKTTWYKKAPVRHLSPFATLSRPESRNARNLVSWFSGKLL